MLRLEHVGSIAGTIARMALGAAACLGIGVVVVSLLVGILYALFGGDWIGWWGWYFLYLLVLVPFLIWHERHTRPDYLADALTSVDPKPLSRGEFEMNWYSFKVAIVSSMLVWGPRTLIDGVRSLRNWRTGQAAILNRAAKIVLRLAKKPGAVEFRDLLDVPEDMQLFGAAVDLLDEHGWVGKSSAGDSIWLDSRCRDKLLRKPPATH